MLPKTSFVLICCYEVSIQGVINVSHKSARAPISCLYLFKNAPEGNKHKVITVHHLAAICLSLVVNER